MSIEEAVKELKASMRQPEEDISIRLDDLVYDEKCAEASDINNSGLGSQLEYVLDLESMNKEQFKQWMGSYFEKDTSKDS